MNEVMTKQEVASYLRCSIRSLERRIVAGEIACFKVGRLVRLKRSEVEAQMQPEDRSKIAAE